MNQRTAAFQHEAFTRRSLVKLADHPELADAAKAQAERLATLEEVRGLTDRLQAQRRESEAHRAAAEEVQLAATTLGERIGALDTENVRLRRYVAQLLADGDDPAPLVSATPARSLSG